eukprot:247408_1
MAASLQAPLLGDDADDAKDNPDFSELDEDLLSIKRCCCSFCKPCCGICLFLAAIITTSILMLQHYVPQFQTTWKHLQYIDDFSVPSIYTELNGKQIAYNNESLLNATIFNDKSNKS